MVMIDNLPRELRECGLFCLWKYEQDSKGRPTKVPYNPNRPDRKADSTDAMCFSQLPKAARMVEAFDGLGVGMFRGMLRKGELCGIDIDHCIDDQGKLTDKAQKIVDRLKWCYWEKSPSGHGLRGFGLVSSDFHYDSETYYLKHGDLEIYVAGATARFLTVTGNVYREGELTDITHELLEVMQAYMRREKVSTLPETAAAEPVGLPDDVIIRKAAEATNGERFRQLWSGDASGYPSDSEADLALCNYLAFWTGKDAQRMDALFRQSGLMREKWDSRRGGSTYGADTINRAIRACKNVYSPRKNTLQPGDYTDIGQAEVYVREYGHKLRYSTATRFLVYDGRRWAEDDLKAQRLSQELTARQLKEAKGRIDKARAALDKLIEAEDQDTEAVKAAKKALDREEGYRSFVLGRRSSTKVRATMTEAAPMVQIEVAALDADGYLLNTPDGTIDLRSGEIREHRAEDYCTKITTVGPGSDGAETWSRFLDDITVGDKALSRYLQEVAGLCAIGAVKREELVIAWGEGSNGKSTFFNLLFRVLGDYSGMLSAETLTTKSRKNKSPEYAELRGKRLIIAAELEESERLDTSVVKKLCSTDPILAEKKYKDPFSFIPSHHVILYTNHLPKVGTNDNGTWRRLVTVPFKARFEEGTGQKKDYASYLFKHCSGAVLSWIVEGARRVITQEFIVRKPDCVTETLDRYREESDWLGAFVSDRCDVAWNNRDTGGNLYAAYKQYCDDMGEFTRSLKDFTHALEAAGYESKKIKTGKIYRGLSVIRYADRMRRDSEITREFEYEMGPG